MNHITYMMFNIHFSIQCETLTHTSNNNVSLISILISLINNALLKAVMTAQGNFFSWYIICTLLLSHWSHRRLNSILVSCYNVCRTRPCDLWIARKLLSIVQSSSRPHYFQLHKYYHATYNLIQTDEMFL